MIKRICSVLLIIAMCFLMCSCGSDVSNGDAANREIKNMSEEIIRCLKENDKEAFKDLFCERVRNIENYDKQVDEFFDYFECKEFISSEYDVSEGSEQITENGEVTEWYTSETIKSIKTIARNPVRNHDIPFDEDVVERDYRIEYYYQIVYADDVSLLGLHSITISLPDEEDEGITVGTDRFNPDKMNDEESTEEDGMDNEE